MMKSWQCGFEIDELKTLEAFYEPYNRYALSPFGKFKKNDIATKLDNKAFNQVNDRDGHVEAAWVRERSKVPSKITMHGKTIIGEKLKGDVTLSRLCGDPETLETSLMHEGYTMDNCWLLSYGGDTAICRLAERLGFKKIGYKVTSFAEIMAVYFRDSDLSLAPRNHPVVNKADLVGMAKIASIGSTLPLLILQKIQLKGLQYTNHYSNYNTKNAWSALALRGYSADAAFITKPAEMNDKWHEAHTHEHFELQDTPLYAQFPEVRKLLTFLDGECHRVRFMRLAPGGGELTRHTDQVDPDAGNSLGALARLHFPLKTNKDVLFSTWNGDDQEERYHFGFGECWVIDTRKPHMAVNGGTEERIHLVVDVIVTPKIERMITEGLSIRA
jgi:hypothetical protein